MVRKLSPGLYHVNLGLPEKPGWLLACLWLDGRVDIAIIELGTLKFDGTRAAPAIFVKEQTSL